MQNLAELPDFDLSKIPDIQYRPLHGMPCRTSNKSTTKAAEAVRLLPETVIIKNIARSDNLWGKLKDYANTVWDGVASRTDNLPEGMKASAPHPFPFPAQQKRAVEILRAWRHLYSLLLQEDEGATCEFSIQDEVTFILKYCFGPALRMRYANTNTPDKVKKSRKKDNKGRWINRKDEPVSPPPNVHLPGFVRAVADMLRSSLETDKAGYPDNLLIADALPDGTGGNRLAVEVKAFWSLSDKIMEDLVSGVVAAPGTGKVDMTADGETMNLLLQLWGECYFCNVDYGFITNGSTVRVFIRTKRNELCFSDVKKWDDPDVFAALLGLCFVSIDHPTRKNKKIKDYLCDVKDRHRDWAKQQPPPEVPKNKRTPSPAKSATPSEFVPSDSETNTTGSDTEYSSTETEGSIVVDSSTEGSGSEGSDGISEESSTEDSGADKGKHKKKNVKIANRKGKAVSSKTSRAKAPQVKSKSAKSVGLTARGRTMSASNSAAPKAIESSVSGTGRKATRKGAPRTTGNTTGTAISEDTEVAVSEATTAAIPEKVARRKVTQEVVGTRKDTLKAPPTKKKLPRVVKGISSEIDTGSSAASTSRTILELTET